MGSNLYALESLSSPDHSVFRQREEDHNGSINDDFEAVLV